MPYLLEHGILGYAIGKYFSNRRLQKYDENSLESKLNEKSDSIKDNVIEGYAPIIAAEVPDLQKILTYDLHSDYALPSAAIVGFVVGTADAIKRRDWRAFPRAAVPAGLATLSHVLLDRVLFEPHISLSELNWEEIKNAIVYMKEPEGILYGLGVACIVAIALHTYKKGKNLQKKIS